MYNLLIEWLSANYTELLGAVLGLAYILLSVNQNIWTWPTGLATSILYSFVFFHSQFYAGMSLQFYYVVISLYGWYFWLKGRRPDQSKELPVSRITSRQFIWSSIIFLVCFALLYIILSGYTDSPVPVMDAFTTSLSIVATWMLARKILENWLIWVVADVASVGLYIYKGLWPTTGLFLVYTGMAVYGYYHWKRSTLKSIR
jgi:nicotinamide mononucleotide transporter